MKAAALFVALFALVAFAAIIALGHRRARRRWREFGDVPQSPGHARHDRTGGSQAVGAGCGGEVEFLQHGSTK